MIALFGIFAVVALVVVVIVAAIATKRPGLGAIFGGLALLAAGFMLMSLFFTQRVVHHIPPQDAHFSVNSPFIVNEAVSHVAHSSYGRISFFGLFILPAVFVALIIAGIVGASIKKSNGGHRGWWPALLLVPLVFFLMIGGIRVTKTSQISTTPSPPAGVNTFPPPGKVHADIRQQIDHGDIHVLMDKSDAPRIDLASEAAAGVAAIVDAPPRVAAEMVATAEGSVSASSHGEASVDEKQDAAAEVSAEPDKTVAAKSSDADGEKGKGEKAAPSSSNGAVVKQDSESKKDIEHSKEADAVMNGSIDTPNEPSKLRPEWVSQQPTSDGNQEVIATDEYATEPECRRATDIYLMFKTFERIQTLAGRPFVDTSLPSLTFNKGTVLAGGHVIYEDRYAEFWQDSRLNQLLKLGIGVDYIRREIVDKQYMEDVERSFGPMHKMYTLVKFTPAVDAELRRHWSYYQRQEQFAQVGVGAASVLGLLGFIYGLLKVDTLTKGYYTKRLFIGVPAAIIGGTVLLSLLV